jgi:hypothetical protein
MIRRTLRLGKVGGDASFFAEAGGAIGITNLVDSLDFDGKLRHTLREWTAIPVRRHSAFVRGTVSQLRNQV